MESLFKQDTGSRNNRHARITVIISIKIQYSEYYITVFFVYRYFLEKNFLNLTKYEESDPTVYYRNKPTKKIISRRTCVMKEYS